MWIFTEDGFYSVAKDDYTNNGYVMVKSREIADLERLRTFADSVNDLGLKIIYLKHTDYPYRMQMPKWLWSDYLSYKGSTIDYPKFKDQVGKKLGADRQHGLLRIWASIKSVFETGTDGYIKVPKGTTGVQKRTTGVQQSPTRHN